MFFMLIVVETELFGDSWSCVFFSADSFGCRTFLFCAEGCDINCKLMVFYSSKNVRRSDLDE